MAQITNNSKQPLIIKSQSSDEIILNPNQTKFIEDLTWKRALESSIVQSLLNEALISVSNYSPPTTPTPTVINMDNSNFNLTDVFPIDTSSAGGFIPVFFQRTSNSSIFDVRFVASNQFGSSSPDESSNFNPAIFLTTGVL